MKTTGIVRRMDELGRVVIPKEIRKTYRIKEGDPIEIYINSAGELVIKKHSPVKDINRIIDGYAETLGTTGDYTVLITDNDNIIAAGGTQKKEYINKPVSANLFRLALQRKSAILSGDTVIEIKSGETPAKSQVVAPILNAGDVFGAVVFVSKEVLTEREHTLAKIAANFIATQLV